MKLTLVHLFPDLLNLYGDRGNIIALRQRCLWRDIHLDVVPLGLGDFYDGSGDLLFIGGDQDREQELVAGDLAGLKGDAIRRAVEGGIPMLAVCGGYQLFQEYYRAASGVELRGLGVFGAHTVHPGWDVPRCVGNIVIGWKNSRLVGFENHGGRTVLDPGSQALGTVVSGYGNNGRDRFEGCQYRNAIGTYMHGSLLPKNPALADHLIGLALSRRYSDVTLLPLDDRLEQQARETLFKRAARNRL